MLFQNRAEAARLLSARLQAYRGRNPLILAIPRGAVPMASHIADTLQGELDVVLVRKIGAPGNPEFAIGAVDESSHTALNPDAHRYGISDDYIRAETALQMDTMRRRRALYTPVRPPLDPSGRIVIVVDDGIATGATMLAALRTLRAKAPAKLIAAIAVLPADSINTLQAAADELVFLHAAEQFYAVGQFFRDFGQVTDEEVVATLGRRGRDDAGTPERPG